MGGQSRRFRDRRRLGGASALLVAVALLAGGCGTPGLDGEEGANAAQGKELFVQKCGGCHTLREAGTKGSTTSNPVSGPNLDEAFAEPRREGYSESTIEAVVRDQIAYPTPPMPKNLVEGADADDVAAYVALVAANPNAHVEGTGTAAGGGSGGGAKSLFVTNCGSCHTLADAGTTGKVGPDLDAAKPTVALAVHQITNGGGSMPAFRGSLTKAQIQALAEYVARSARG